MNKQLIMQLEKIPKELLNQFPILKLVVDKTNELAKTGLTTDEIEEIIMQSEEYQELVNVSAQISKASEQYSDEYLNEAHRSNDDEDQEDVWMKIDDLARDLYEGKKIGKHPFSEEMIDTYDNLFNAMDLKIQIEDLVNELIYLGEVIGLDRPVPLSVFLHLLNGTTILDNLTLLQKLSENEEKVYLFFKKFDEKYKQPSE